MTMIYNIEELSIEIERNITRINWGKQPEELYKPIEYILGSAGKRIRPLLTLMACNMFSDNIENAISPAIGIEMFHNFTLLHDDLMDDAPVRRGNETVHLKWNANTAILSGDAMMVEAYRFICESPNQYLKSILAIFNETALGVCEGQMLDMQFENRNNVSEDEYIEMIRLKTSVLIAASLQIGAIIGGASESNAKLLYDFGINLGLAFQLLDDWLDTFSNPEVFGKRTGGDIVENKKTFLLINALKLADNKQKTELQSWIAKTNFNEEEKINAIKSIYEKLKIGEIALLKAEEFSVKAFDCLNKIDVPESRKKLLLELGKNLLKRDK